MLLTVPEFEDPSIVFLIHFWISTEDVFLAVFRPVFRVRYYIYYNTKQVILLGRMVEYILGDQFVE